MGLLERQGGEKEVEHCGKEGKESWAKVLKVQKHPSFLSQTWQNILKQGETSTGAMVPYIFYYIKILYISSSSDFKKN